MSHINTANQVLLTTYHGKKKKPKLHVVPECLEQREFAGRIPQQSPDAGGQEKARIKVYYVVKESRTVAREREIPSIQAL